jgi:hypothetical protein
MINEHRKPIHDLQGRPIGGTRAFLIGNNASWICCGCGELLGGRTGEREKAITCDCGKAYILFSSPNKHGVYDKGSAESVVLK